jgi:uncharacterized protein DUF6484
MVSKEHPMTLDELAEGRPAAPDEVVTPDPLKSLLDRTVGRPELPPNLMGVLVGQLIAICARDSVPLVYCAALSEKAMPARTTVALHAGNIGCEVVLAFENGSPQVPIISGVIRGGTDLPIAPDAKHVRVEEEGGRVVLEARQELVLQCGSASIRLQADGTVQVRGMRIVSDADGSVRIRGGSVQLN